MGSGWGQDISRVAGLAERFGPNSNLTRNCEANPRCLETRWDGWFAEVRDEISAQTEFPAPKCNRRVKRRESAGLWYEICVSPYGRLRGRLCFRQLSRTESLGVPHRVGRGKASVPSDALVRSRGRPLLAEIIINRGVDAGEPLLGSRAPGKACVAKRVGCRRSPKDAAKVRGFTLRDL